MITCQSRHCYGQWARVHLTVSSDMVSNYPVSSFMKPMISLIFSSLPSKREWRTVNSLDNFLFFDLWKFCLSALMHPLDFVFEYSLDWQHCTGLQKLPTHLIDIYLHLFTITHSRTSENSEHLSLYFFAQWFMFSTASPTLIATSLYSHLKLLAMI